MASEPDDGGFLSRWSRRKVQQRTGQDAAEPLATTPAVPADAPLADAAAGSIPAPPAAQPPPPPTLADVAALTRESDYARFVAPGVDGRVKNAALKKLFTDPHFNLMDGLDTYIDDYGVPDPLPEGMLRQMAQSQALGLFTDDPPGEADLPAPVAEAATLPEHPSSPSAPTLPNPDEDTGLRLQPHDAAGPSGAGRGADADSGRQP